MAWQSKATIRPRATLAAVAFDFVATTAHHGRLVEIRGNTLARHIGADASRDDILARGPRIHLQAILAITGGVFDYRRPVSIRRCAPVSIWPQQAACFSSIETLRFRAAIGRRDRGAKPNDASTRRQVEK